MEAPEDVEKAIRKSKIKYDSKGLDAPYKTLGAFRRARRAQAQSYRDNRKEWGAREELAKST